MDTLVFANFLRRGKGHALINEYHHASTEAEGARRFAPSFPTSTLVAVPVAFMLGGLVVSAADETGNGSSSHTRASVATVWH